MAFAIGPAAILAGIGGAVGRAVGAAGVGTALSRLVPVAGRAISKVGGFFKRLFGFGGAPEVPAVVNPRLIPSLRNLAAPQAGFTDVGAFRSTLRALRGLGYTQDEAIQQIRNANLRPQ